MKLANIIVPATVALGLWSSAALVQSVTIGQVGNPTPMQAARASGAIEEATG